MATLSCRPVITLDAINTDLQSAVAQIMQDLTELQRTANSPQLIDHAWIIDRIKGSSVGEGYLLKPAFPSIEAAGEENGAETFERVANHGKAEEVAGGEARKGLGLLTTIPLEVRRMIYRPLLASGQLSILRTSHAMHQEASELLFAEGICRIKYGFSSYFPSFKPNQDLASKIQNVRVEACLGYLFDEFVPWNDSVIRQFGGSAFSRKKFIVHIKHYPWYILRDQDPLLFKGLSTLSGFEEVYVKVSRMKYSDVELQFVEKSSSLWSIHRKMIKKGAYKKFMLNLERFLGPADWQGHSAVFHSRRNLANVSGEKEKL
ncbi:hypothetical protein MMC28_001045 [Mycoblastus sanguinarius]|nr:hypothetical protein [Mycoblastus sanguinarius]